MSQIIETRDVRVHAELLRAIPDLTRTVSIARRSDMAPTHAAAAMQALLRRTADRLVVREHGLVTRV